MQASVDNVSFVLNPLNVGVFFAKMCRVVLLAAAFFVPVSVYAGDPGLRIQNSAYKAQYVSQTVPDPVVITAGETKLVKFTFKNVGTATWSAYGGRHISAYAVVPTYRNSKFSGQGWVSSEQTALISGTVKPGEVGEPPVYLHAPDEPGEYVERFHFSADNHTWVDDGYFFVIIKVVPKERAKSEEVEEVVVEEVSAEEAVAEATPASNHKANRFIQSKKSVSAKGGKLVKLILGFQNVGD